MLDYDLTQRGEFSLYDYLYQRIRADILSGELEAGQRLPSKRSLAAHLGVSVVTIEGAYGQLVAEGYVRTRPRSGYFVCELPKAAVSHSVATRQEDSTIDEETAAPDTLGYDEDAARLWARALRATLNSEPESEVFSVAPAQGLPRLRRAIAAHLRQSRGLVVRPSQIVVGAGAQVLDIMVSQLVGDGKVFAVEDPGYLRLTRLYQNCGHEVRHVSLDASGPSMESLVQTNPDVLHLMPSHQFPTGCVTSVSRRYELLGWASEGEGRWLVEDDFDCEFRLAGKPVPALASIDAAGRVIYTNTFSKSLGSALRLAYMVLPEELVERFGGSLGFYSSTVSSAQQVALARILEDGSYERHVSRLRKRCRDARDELLAALRSRPDAGKLRFENVDAGLHLVMAAESNASEEYLAHRAIERGAQAGSVLPLSSFVWDPAHATFPDALRRLVIRYDTLTPETIDALAGLEI